MTGQVTLHSAAGLITIASPCGDVSGTAQQLLDLAAAIQAAVRRADRARADGEQLPMRAPIDDMVDI